MTKICAHGKTMQERCLACELLDLVEQHTQKRLDTLVADNIRLTTAVKRLLAAVDFTAPPRADVRIRDLWGAATALQELRELVQDATPGFDKPAEIGYNES